MKEKGAGLVLLGIGAAFLIALSLSQDAPADDALYKEAQNFLDRKYGFRGIRFGTKARKIPGLYKSNQEVWGTLCDETLCSRYERRGDTLELFGVELKYIVYDFYKGRLFRVAFHASEEGGEEAFRKRKSDILKVFEKALESKLPISGESVTLVCYGRHPCLLYQHHMSDKYTKDRKKHRMEKALSDF